VIKGVKTACERFAGAESTFTIEAQMQNGWALQSGTSHFLGQNFAKAFDVYFQTHDNKRELVWATSWGVSTRLIGALVMCHSDDKGLVLPPRLAPSQVVFIPILSGKLKQDELVLTKVRELCSALRENNIRALVDERPYTRPGAKFYEWERKGVPIRIDIGPRDLENSCCHARIRLSSAKISMPLTREILVERLTAQLQDIQDEMLSLAVKRLESRLFRITKYEEMRNMLENVNTTGFYLVPWMDSTENEQFIKKDCKATIRCYPFEYNRIPLVNEKCFFSGKPATHYALFSRAY
jgi:prolyl-tRNA synthetase